MSEPVKLLICFLTMPTILVAILFVRSFFEEFLVWVPYNTTTKRCEQIRFHRGHFQRWALRTVPNIYMYGTRALEHYRVPLWAGETRTTKEVDRP